MNQASADREIGRLVRSRRTALGMSQGALGRAVQAGDPTLWDVGSAQTTIARTEAGTRSLKAREAVIFAQVLGLSVEELLGVEPAPTDAEVLRDARLGRAVRGLIENEY